MQILVALDLNNLESSQLDSIRVLSTAYLDTLKGIHSGFQEQLSYVTKPAHFQASIYAERRELDIFRKEISIVRESLEEIVASFET